MEKPAEVILEVMNGPLKGTTYVFDGRTSTIAGRTAECQPLFPDDPAHQTVSRHHCLLDINPPQIRVRDLGSLNGTFVNDRGIGRRDKGQSPEVGAKTVHPEVDLKDGDRLRFGDMEVLVRTRSGEEEATAAGRKDCAACGEALGGLTGAHPLEGVLCRKCRKSPVAALKALMLAARLGVPELKALRGLKVVKTLGRGTTGAVFLAQYPKIDRTVALKVLLPEMAAGSWVVASFLREVENTKALTHPNVVRLFDSGSYLGLFFYTMEYCDGGTVEDLRQKKGGRMSLKTALPIIVQALEGLEYVHNVELPRVKLADGSYGRGKGLVHRDLKPANIFLARTPNGVLAKIADVGVGKAFDSAGLSGLTRTGSVAGTPVVTPRQQVINFKYAKPDVDVWAMAASLYKLLTGEYPRDFPDDKDPWRVVLESQAVPIRRRDPSVPLPLAEVIDEALIDYPEIKVKNAAVFKKALIAAYKKSMASG